MHISMMTSCLYSLG